ncbi:dihydrodipicolinate synthase family protein [Pedobacter sp. PLR]|uniref:dihydrodipicolinate synthase family protein n=1 Tax=Pedobacter sp. PLR TaxID=2994465 RepID=UPI002245C168|nr:dihydrodipicolinate synthase family protein [Pedobacter sp. PLR]MCX2450109.1 dihydrodipicolinate synthase family protein [Pedobacter sp. PLR]
MTQQRFLKGLIAAPFTPMDEAGKVNLSVIETYAELIDKNEVSGVFICGTTGESMSLTTDERKSIAGAWVAQANKRFKVIVHVGGTSQPQSIELAAHAQEIGADAISLMAPGFFKPEKVKDLVDFFEPIAAAAASLPFYYYNMPSITGVFLPVNEFLQQGKARIPNLKGVKYTHNNLMEMQQCINLNDGEFEVLHGFDEILLTGLAIGATAAVGSTYNYIPALYNEIMDLVKEGNLEKARILQNVSVDVISVVIKHGGGVRGGKAIMNLLGLNCGPCRSPIAEFTKNEYKELKVDLEKIGFFNLVNQL